MGSVVSRMKKGGIIRAKTAEPIKVPFEMVREVSVKIGVHIGAN